MQVIIKQTAGKDYPAHLKGNKIYKEATVNTIRRRLELRPQDEVIIEEVAG